MHVLVRRLWIQLTADRKRFTILCTMLAIGLLLWGRIIVTSNMPRTAVADPNGQTGTLPPPVVGGTDPSLDKWKIPTVQVKLAVLPNRDPLLISNRHFPKPTPIELLPADGPKLPPDATENLQQAETRLTEELRVLVDKFKLEAVMQGQMAVINGKTHELYNRIPSVTNEAIRFQLIQVGHRSVILECADRRFKLKMDYPGNEER